MAVRRKDKDETPVQEEKKPYHLQYYERNAKALSEKRKKKYQEDPKYRQAAIERSKTYRETHGKSVEEGVVVKLIDNREVKGYRIGKVSELIGRSLFVIRSWEAEGLIPLPTFPSAKRTYTDRQVQLMGQLSDELKAVEGSYKKEAEVKDRFKRIIHHGWGG